MKGLWLLALVVMTGPAMAQEDLRIDQSKVYVTDPAACGALEKQGIDAFVDIDFLALTFDRGIQSMEFHCNFYDVKGREGGNHFFIDAICELPGAVYPDILAVTPYGDNTIQVVSQADMLADMSQPAAGTEAEPSQTPPGVTIYTRCDNLSEISVD